MNVIPTYLISIKLVHVIKRAPCWHVSLSWLYPRSGLILGLPPANERRRYKVTPSLIGWAQTYYQPWRLWYASHHWYHSWCVPEFARNVLWHHTTEARVTSRLTPNHQPHPPTLPPPPQLPHAALSQNPPNRTSSSAPTHTFARAFVTSPHV